MATVKSYTIKKWNLDELFTGFDSPELEGAFDNVEELVTSFEGLRGKLKPDIDAETFLDAVRASESMTRLVNRIYAFAGLSFAEDTQNQNAQSLLGRVQQFVAEMQNRTLFFSLWWKDLDEANAERLMSASDDYRYYLEEMRHFKPHTLTEPEEKIVNLKDVTGSNALVNLYDAITNRYVFKLEVDGEVKELTRAQLQPYIQGPDADLRAKAYQELYRVYGEDGPILGQMYQTLARDWHNENIALRKFSSPMSVRNLANDVPDEAVNTLLEVTKKNAKIFQRYFKMKAKHVGMEKLRRYDIYAPVAKSDKPFEFDTAANMVFDAFSAFDPKIGELARRVFDQDHLDSEVRKGKQGGAFCASINPDDTPYVLMNYTGRARDVAAARRRLARAARRRGDVDAGGGRRHCVAVAAAGGEPADWSGPLAVGAGLRLQPAPRRRHHARAGRARSHLPRLSRLRCGPCDCGHARAPGHQAAVARMGNRSLDRRPPGRAARPDALCDRDGRQPSRGRGRRRGRRRVEAAIAAGGGALPAGVDGGAARRLLAQRAGRRACPSARRARAGGDAAHRPKDLAFLRNLRHFRT